MNINEICTLGDSHSRYHGALFAGSHRCGRRIRAEPWECHWNCGGGTSAARTAMETAHAAYWRTRPRTEADDRELWESAEALRSADAAEAKGRAS